MSDTLHIWVAAGCFTLSTGCGLVLLYMWITRDR